MKYVRILWFRGFGRYFVLSKFSSRPRDWFRAHVVSFMGRFPCRILRYMVRLLGLSAVIVSFAGLWTFPGVFNG